METARGVVEFRLRPRSFLFPRGLLGLFMLAGLAWVLIDGDGGLVSISVIALNAAIQLAIPMIGYLSARRHPVAIRLSAEGVEWPAAKAHRSWGEVAAVRVRSQKGTRYWFPGLVLVSPRELDFARRSNTPPPGHGIDTRHLVEDREDVLAAILRFREVPVYRD